MSAGFLRVATTLSPDARTYSVSFLPKPVEHPVTANYIVMDMVYEWQNSLNHTLFSANCDILHCYLIMKGTLNDSPCPAPRLICTPIPTWTRVLLSDAGCKISGTT